MQTVTKTKKSSVKAPPASFEAGQKWQLELGYAEIVHVGKVLVDYRFYRVANQKRVPIETKSIRDFAEALKKNKAKLVAEGQTPA
jgi:hypothetical protein